MVTLGSEEVSSLRFRDYREHLDHALALPPAHFVTMVVGCKRFPTQNECHHISPLRIDHQQGLTVIVQ